MKPSFMQRITTRAARIPDDLEQIKRLWTDYLTWGNNEMQARFGVHPHDPATTVRQDVEKIDHFLPPHGQLILADNGEKACGVGCLRRIGEGLCEVKRMYVEPATRGTGTGRAILDHLIDEARRMGYRTIRLDSPVFMEAAHGLYRSSGFREIEPYAESEIPTGFRKYLLFMEREL